MSDMDPNALYYALESYPATPYSRPVRVRVRGKRESWWAHMAGGVRVVGTLETTEEVERLMVERKAVEV